MYYKEKVIVDTRFVKRSRIDCELLEEKYGAYSSDWEHMRMYFLQQSIWQKFMNEMVCLRKQRYIVLWEVWKKE